jgi:fumarate reductase flavoprotein subunit
MPNDTIAENFDVVVIGAGGSGLAAACSAARHGAKVLVLEKQPQPGGTTGIAVGSFTAAGTRLQHQAGIDDRPADHAEDAARFATAEIESHNNADLRAWFLCEAAETLAWLESFGLSFVGPSPDAQRVPRMHNVVPGAKAYIAALQLDLQRQGAR